MQPLGRPADVALVQHDLKEKEKVEVHTGEVNSVQHIDEIISLDSASLKCDVLSKRAQSALGIGGTGATRMSVSRRSILAAASAGVSLSQTARSAKASAQAQREPAINQTVADLVQRSAEANAALMRGEITKYYEVIPHTDDFMLMSPFGGKPTRASELTPERIEAMGRFFKNGTFEQELLQAYGSTDMVVLATVERAHVEVGGLPAQDWALRVTLVYRREGSDWRLVHRHADPLVKGVSLDQAAALAIGKAA